MGKKLTSRWGFYPTGAANGFGGGVIGSKIFGIPEAITLFPLKLRFGN